MDPWKVESFQALAESSCLEKLKELEVKGEGYRRLPKVEFSFT